MKKKLLSLLLMLCNIALFAQGTFHREWPETYIETTLTQSQLDKIATDFSVDKVTRNADGTFNVRLCIGLPDYDRFENSGIPFTIATAPKANVSMASTYQELVAEWNKYPTYGAYIEAMQTFQNEFPDLCKIDTILAQTPDNHALLVAHISNTLNDRAGKPSFFYTSTMHGDEPVGYYFMLRLIHYLLHNYATDSRVQEIVNNVDLWICPLENPDGTYHTNNDILNESPVSTRYNANYVDINRAYPLIGQSSKTNDLEPEIQAMIDFGSAHQFTMSANFHGGAEVFNYPWDIWTGGQATHADNIWWQMVGRDFADSCHAVSPFYMTDLNNGVTSGGDWYVITGSRQDYFNYFLNCREATIEVSTSKVVSSSSLPTYWSRIRASLLNYIGECRHGLHGVVTDSLTGDPIAARVYVENHDRFNSHVYSRLPHGDYHRPIKAGNYQVTYSAEGYYPKTLSVSISDGQRLTRDVQLVPIVQDVADHDGPYVQLFPNPTTGACTLCSNAAAIDRVELYDATGRLLRTTRANGHTVTLDLSDCASGVYHVRIFSEKGVVTERVMKR